MGGAEAQHACFRCGTTTEPLRPALAESGLIGDPHRWVCAACIDDWNKCYPRGPCIDSKAAAELPGFHRTRR